MGRVTTPTFRVEIKTNAPAYLTDGVWNSRTMGRPTAENAEAYRQRLNQSFLPGGVNGPRNDTDVVIHVHTIRIVRQSNNEVVAEAKAPMFEVVEAA